MLSRKLEALDADVKKAAKGRQRCPRGLVLVLELFGGESAGAWTSEIIDTESGLSQRARPSKRPRACNPELCCYRACLHSSALAGWFGVGIWTSES